VKDVVMLVIVVAAFVAGGSLIMFFGLLPEEHADEFRSLATGNMTLQSEVITIREPTSNDDTFIYAINKIAADAVNIALNSSQVKQILQGVPDSAVTIAGVQPTLLVDSSGKLIHSSVGQVIITANQERLDGRTVNDAITFESVQGKQIRASQQIWSVIVDLDKGTITSVSKGAERQLESDIRSNLILAEMNIFMPHSVKVEPGATVRWLNDSSVPHNVVGMYVRESNDPVRIDSGFFQEDRSFQYTFEEEGLFEYRCTIHSEEGMKGVLVVGR
jgi:plastocyanin